jgi:hypothetical protein
MRGDVETSGCECVRFAKQVRELSGEVGRERGSVRKVVAIDNEQLGTLASASEVGVVDPNPEELCQVGAGHLPKHVALCKALPFNQPRKFNWRCRDDYHIRKKQHAHPEYIFVHSQLYVWQRVYALFRASIDTLLLSVGQVFPIHVYYL